jgi:hypothetical protein
MRFRCTLTAVLLLAGAGLAQAQHQLATPPPGVDDKPVTTNKAMGDTINISAGGAFVLEYVNRSREITAFTDSASNPTGAGAPLTSDGEGTFEGFAAVRLVAQLTGNVTVTTEFGSKRVEGDLTDTPPGGINRWGDDTAQSILLREANVNFGEFFLPQLSANVGIINYDFDVRGRGQSFVMAPRRSQTLSRNLDSDQVLNHIDFADNRFAESAFPDEVEPAGAVFTWSQEQMMLHVVLAPAMVEHGSPSADEALYAIDFWYLLDQIVGKGSRVGFIVAWMKDPTFIVDGVSGLALAANTAVHTDIFTLGGGTDLKFMNGAVDAFIEGYVQRGKAGEVDPDGLGLGSPSTTDIDAKGNAFQLGGTYTYTVGNPLPFWAGAAYFYLSGEDSTDPANDSAGKFASYEAVNDLLILEDPYYGFDWDSNYKGFKVNVGARWTAFTEQDLETTLIVGTAKASEKVLLPSGQTEDKLGTEVDLRVNWSLGKQAALKFAFAYLSGSDLLEAAMEPGGPGTNPDADDKAMLWLLGVDVKY